MDGGIGRGGGRKGRGWGKWDGVLESEGGSGRGASIGRDEKWGSGL